jgi:hypothetical protein
MSSSFPGAVRRAASVGIAALLLSCGHPLERALQGRWLGDGVENFDDNDIAMATGWAKGTSMEFLGKTLTVSIPAEEPRKGHYYIAKVHNTDLDLSVVRLDGRVDSVHFKLDEENSMRWMLEGSRAVILKRQP